MGLLDRFFGPPTKDKFARMMLDAIRKAGEKDPVRYDPERFRLYPAGDFSASVFASGPLRPGAGRRAEDHAEDVARQREWRGSRPRRA